MEAYFLAVGGAIGWPISFPRNLIPRTRSIFPKMMLLGIPLKVHSNKIFVVIWIILLYSPSCFVVIHDLRFLVNLRSKILLTQAFGLSALLDDTSNRVVNAFVLQFFSLSVKFCSIPGRRMLLIRSSVDWNMRKSERKISTNVRGHQKTSSKWDFIDLHRR